MIKFYKKHREKEKVWIFAGLLIVFIINTATLYAKQLQAPSGIRIETEFKNDNSVSIILKWNDVTKFTDNTSASESLYGYRVLKTTEYDTNWEEVALIKKDSDKVYSEEYHSIREVFSSPAYYKVCAVAKYKIYDNDSVFSMIADTSINRNIIATDKLQKTALVIPKQISSILYREHNHYNEDLFISLEIEYSGNLSIRIYKAASMADITDEFSFEKPMAQIILSDNSANIYTFSSLISAHNTFTGTTYDDPRSIHWDNGFEWIDLNSEHFRSHYSTKIKKLGAFKLAKRSLKPSSETFELTSVYPKTFTPSGNAPYDQVEFILSNNSDYRITGKIFDISGAFVTDMKTGLITDSLSWNGSTNDGNTAQSGIYIYKITGNGNKNITGTIVLAR
ncbi:hypothetical protein ACFLR5_00775 [Elusimicrobiota bacterium]